MKSEFEKYAEFAFSLALDSTKSGYPTYCDGIKTKAMFMERSLSSFDCETEDMLIFEHEGTVEGLIHYYWIPEDMYLSTAAFNINVATEQAIKEFTEYVKIHFQKFIFMVMS